MENKNEEQNNVIFSIAEILGKMSNQVSFLIRNKKFMSQLDVDMLMENTRKLYDTVCSVRCNMEVDSIPMEIVEGEDNWTDKSVEVQRYKGIEVSEELDIDEEESRVDDAEEEGEPDYEGNIDEADNDNESDALVEEIEETEETEYADDNDAIDEDVEQETFEEEVVPFNMEDEELYDNEAEIKFDFEIPSSDTMKEHVDDSGIKAYKKVNNEYFSIGDVLEQSEDNSLAARLQKKPIADLSTAIGINDKFLLLNELFGGSMDKYNKSIRALNNFSTYLGAKTYMSELQIELQWDCESDAYKKLSDLVERRFIAIHNS